MNLNGGSLLGNACVMRVRNGFNNNAQTLNGGWIQFDPGTTWQNNGTFLQGIVGITTGANMTNSGSVTGFGEFSFTGNTVTQGTFSGLSAAQPIVFDDTSPTGSQIFDTQNGTVTNVVAAPVTRSGLADLPFGCGTVPPATADVSVVQAGPAVVAPGGTITYTIVAVNRGPIAATGVVVTEALPPALSGVAADGGGVVGGGAVTWTVGGLAVGATRIFTVTGTAPASGTLVAVVSSAATSIDGRPGNNDGSSPNAIVTTVVDAAPPANQPPVVEDVSIDWIPTARVAGVCLWRSRHPPGRHRLADDAAGARDCDRGAGRLVRMGTDRRIHRHRHVRRDRLRQRQPEPVRHRHRHHHDRADPADDAATPRTGSRSMSTWPPTTWATPDRRRSSADRRTARRRSRQTAPSPMRRRQASPARTSSSTRSAARSRRRSAGRRR